ncbi:hypothetical protein L6R50_09565 [Myxococcota bacterium]|nr:hypothetical protein [Myxococcota bacterium]
MVAVKQSVRIVVAILALGALAVLPGLRSARADTSNWDWFAYLQEMPRKAGCEGSPNPNQTAWNDVLGGQAPSRDDLVLFSLAYPCGASPTRFVQTRAWKNWYVFGSGSYSASWDGQPFLKLGPTAVLLEDAGFWPDGPL